MPPQERINELFVLYNQGQLAEARAHGEILSEQYPEAAILLNILGTINFDLGHTPKSVALYRKALKIDPTYFEAYYNLGNILRLSGKDEEAIDSYDNAISIKPDYFEALNNLGLVLMDVNKLEEACGCFAQALEINPDYYQAHFNLGNALRYLGKPIEAVSEFEKSLKIRPECAETLHKLGLAFNDLGKYLDAMACYSKGLENSPHCTDIEILYSISQLPPKFISLNILLLVEKTERRPGQDEDYFKSVHAFVKAAALHNSGRFKEAWVSLNEANQTLEKWFCKEYPNHLRITQAVLKKCIGTPPRNQGQPISDSQSPVSLFLLGPSRSGKTTIERLLSGVPGVVRGSENPVLENSINRVYDQAGISTSEPLVELSAELNGILRNCYVDKLKSLTGDARIFTNTAPLNIKNVDLAVSVIPNAKFVFVKRSLEDLIFRIFMTRFPGRNPFDHNVKKIKYYVDWYNNMIGALSKKYPEISMVIHYEDLVEDPAASLNAIAQLCGVDVSDAELVGLGDDRHCSKPYREYITEELNG